MTTSGALRGAGDTVVPGVVTVILSWGVIVLGGLATVKYTNWGSLGPWIAAATYIACLGTFLLARFIHGKWRTIDILKRSAGAAAHS